MRMVIDCNTSVSNINPGCRVECTGHYGTVRYVGSVDGYNGSWLGIEWDDPSRGKHDGSVGGTRYFDTSGPTSGSFVRPGKVQLGKSAVLAITSRYGQKEEGAEAQVNQLQLLNLQKEINAPFLTMVGFDKINLKQSQFQDLYVVSLRMQFVNGPGEDGELFKLCPNIRELDLSKNLFHDWSTVFTICRQLPHLHWLNLSDNYIEMPEDTQDASFDKIKTLICGHMKLTWEDIIKITQIFPAIEEFRLPYNSISSIILPENHNLSCLQLLDIKGNQVKHWSEMLILGQLSALEHLNISDTAIREIYFPCEWNEKTNLFIKLNHLVISENQIDNWQSISELNKLQYLEELRFLKNPVLEKETVATCVQLVIARIGNLKMLNGTLIKADERKGAEYDYIKKHGLQWIEVSKNENTKQVFLVQHPRYLDLITKYGAAEESELVEKSHLLKSSLTSVELHFEDRIVVKKLPPTMTVQKLITLVQKLFKLSERPTLYYTNSAQPNFEVEMSDEFKEIGFYSLQDGDKIFVRV